MKTEQVSTTFCAIFIQVKFHKTLKIHLIAFSRAFNDLFQSIDFAFEMQATVCNYRM